MPGARDHDTDTGANTSRLAVALALAAGIAAALAPALGATRPSTDPIAAAWIVAGLCALLGPGCAAVALARKHVAVACGIVAGTAAVAVGLVLLDIGVLVAPIDANRFELLRPDSAADLTPAVGAYVAFAGHAVAIAAGLLALAALPDQTDDELFGRPVAVLAGSAWSGLMVVTAAVLAATVFPAAWTSTDPVIVTAPAIESGGLAIAAYAALSSVVVITVIAALATNRVSAAASVVTGAAIAMLGLVGARVAAGAVDDRLSTTPPALTAAAAAFVLLLTGVATPWVVAVRHRARRRRRTVAMPPMTPYRWHVVAGSAGITTALLIGLGAVLPVLTLPGGRPEPDVPATRVALVAAIVLLVASVWLLLSEFAALVRPAVGPICAAVVTAAAGVLQADVEGMRVPDVGVGAGSILLAVGVLGAAVTSLLIAFAGSAERDDIDLAATPPPDRTTVGLASAGAVVSVVAFALPVYRGRPDAASFALPWGWDSWGQALSAVVVAAAVGVAAKSRPARAGALLAGCAVGVALYLAGWPLTIGAVADGRIGPGSVVAAAAAILLVGSSVLAFRRERATNSVAPRRRK